MMEIMDVNTEESVTAPQNSEFREHSRKLLESAAGEAPELVSEQRSVKQVLDLELHSNTSECSTENILKNCGIVGNRQM